MVDGIFIFARIKKLGWRGTKNGEWNAYQSPFYFYH
jgi:hypothetical protein